MESFSTRDIVASNNIFEAHAVQNIPEQVAFSKAKFNASKEIV